MLLVKFVGKKKYFLKLKLSESAVHPYPVMGSEIRLLYLLIQFHEQLNREVRDGG